MCYESQWNGLYNFMPSLCLSDEYFTVRVVLTILVGSVNVGK